MSTKPHFLARKFQDFQRSAASQGYLCSFCDDGFQQEPKLWEHAKSLHRHELNINDSGDEQEVRKKFAKSANERMYGIFPPILVGQPLCKPQLDCWNLS